MTKIVGLGAVMTGGARVLQRERQERDWYPTPSDVTQALVNRHSLAGRRVWEPCCGDGAMSTVLRLNGATVHQSDIEPQVEDAATLDFFWTMEMPGGCEAIVTNPPFVRAADFIWHAMKLKPKFVAVLLKSTFWHAVRRRPLFDAHPPTHVHPLTWRPDFLGLGGPTMDVIWTVWDLSKRRRKTTIYEPMDRP